MKTQTKEIYKCDFCNKLYQIKVACEKHENLCFKNPKNNRPCFDCLFLEKRKSSISGIYYDGSEWQRGVSVFHCSAKKIFLYPQKVEAKKNMLELDEDSNEPMPKDCKEFKSNDILDLKNLL